MLYFFIIFSSLINLSSFSCNHCLNLLHTIVFVTQLLLLQFELQLDSTLAAPPVFITEKRLAADKSIAKTLADSIALGTGQFCTNPGMIIFCDSQGGSNILSEVSMHLSKMSLSPMVHNNIEKSYLHQLEELNKNKALKLFKTPGNYSALGIVTSDDIFENIKLTEEVFGPFSLFVKCKSIKQMQDLIKIIPGQLTATILSNQNEYLEIEPLVTKLKNKVGRLLFGGVPTGVAVTQAMQHGGPYPSTTDARYTSVGTDAIYRWLRPISFQDCPKNLLPLELQDDNPLGILRSIDGHLTKKSL